jgi:hypothetical protein
MLYLVEATITRNEYMSYSESFNTSRLVEADNIDDAYTKFHRYWFTKSSDYSVTYSIGNFEIHGVIQ